jgi:hypothetical protein
MTGWKWHNSLDPAQPSNDLVGIKKKYGRKLVIAAVGTVRTRKLPDVDEQFLR